MIRLLIGGSPCRHWSIAQTNNRETQAEGIGWELFRNYLIAKEKWNPDYFLYENNKSAAEPIKAQIRKELGVHEKIHDVEQLEGQLSLFDEDFDNGVRFTYINSALVSAQNRQRFYVTNFGDIEQPKDRGILLKDVLDGAVALREKGHAILQNAGRINEKDFFERAKGNLVGERIPLSEREMDYMVRDSKGNYSDRFSYTQKPAESDKALCITANISKGVTYNVCAEPVQVGSLPRPNGELSESQAFRIYDTDAKSVTLKAQGGGSGAKTGLYAEPVCVAERGRMYRGEEQHYEARTDGKTNTLTSIEKDNRIALPINVTSDGKSQTLKSQYCKNNTENFVCYTSTYGASGVAESIPNLNVPEATSKGYAEIECGDCVDMQHLGSKNRRGRSMKNKSNAMQTTNDFYQYIGYAIEFDESGKPVKAIGKNGKEITIYEVKDGKITIKDKQYPIKLVDGFYIIRKLTVSECKRLQTVPDWYEFPVSDSQAYKQLGNGWTVEVIKHLLSHIPHIQEEEIEVLSMYDGMSCGQIARKELGCNVVKYTAYEIDKYAIQTTQHNFPNTIQKGDAFAVRDEDWSI